MSWHFKGSPPFLAAQGDRLGVSRILTDRARHSPEIHRIAILLGQLCERWHRALKDDSGHAAVFQSELGQVKGTLSECEGELAKLHALAGAAQAMIDEGYGAYGLAAPDRHFRVACDFDEASSPSTADLLPITIPGDSSRKAKAAK